MNVTVVGTGYVGLVVGTCLANTGNDVVCVDIDAEKVARLNRGEIPIYEPGLEELAERNQREGRLTFTTDLDDAVRDARVVFIAVGTPQSHDGAADLSAVSKVAEQLAPSLDGEYTVVVLKSTVPVGTNARIKKILESAGAQAFDVVSNPEFLKEGAAVADFQKPDRVVVGASSQRARDVMADLYGPFVRTGKPILFMDPASAEMTKYAANTMLATKISLMNEIAALCEAVGADVEEVRRGIGTDSRIGFPFIFPGLGFGGSCFPKDIRALSRLGDELSTPQKIATAVDEVNQEVRERFLERIKNSYDDIAGKTLAVWGLAFKPRTDDMREAPSVTLIEGLLEAGARVQAFDPVAMPTASHVFGDRIRLTADAYAALRGAHGLVLVTEWEEFRHADFERMAQSLERKVVFDGRNIWDPAKLVQLGFEYHGVGRPTQKPALVKSA